MAESEPLSDSHGQSKLEVWMSTGLKDAVSDRADELDIPMAEYARRVLASDLADEQERDERELEAEAQ